MGKITKTAKTSVHPWQVERRKYQNAAAQRRRRAKRKEQEQLSRLAVEHGLSPGNESRQLQTGADGARSISYELTDAMFNSLASDAERTNLGMIMAAENFSLRDVIKYGLITLGHSMYPELYRFAENLPFHNWIALILPTVMKRVNLVELVTAGVETLARLDAPQEWPGELSAIQRAGRNEHFFGSPEPTGTPTFPIEISFFTACLANARFLGLNPRDIMKDEAISPFSARAEQLPDKEEYRAQFTTYGSTASSPDELPSHGFTNDMAPTMEQLTITHHPYLDLIPWPSFRARAIVASSMEPPMIDEGDLCLDLLNNGIYCWGMRGASLHGRGEGTPWDSRSWEAKPWFLKKWSLLTGPDVRQGSVWWRSRS